MIYGNEEIVKLLAEDSLRKAIKESGLEGTLEMIEKCYANSVIKNTMLEVFWKRIINKK